IICSSVNLARFICPSFRRPDSNFNWRKSAGAGHVAFIEARPLIDGSRNIVPFLYLKNVSERPILISWPDGDLSRFRVARDDSIDGILATMFEGETTISLSAGADAVLPLHRPRSYEEIDPENVLEWIATWQLAQPILWRTPRKLRVQIRKRDFEALIDGYVAKH
ncbi:hypothetical protein, partial [Bradyrhizobium sp. 145]|uniref:hypothetical protein n=1 Tax=Bradyrhizobium sp. 145 TaxID=2782621 RepID=UPI001FFA8796